MKTLAIAIALCLPHLAAAQQPAPLSPEDIARAILIRNHLPVPPPVLVPKEGDFRVGSEPAPVGYHWMHCGAGACGSMALVRDLTVQSPPRVVPPAAIPTTTKQPAASKPIVKAAPVRRGHYENIKYRECPRCGWKNKRVWVWDALPASKIGAIYPYPAYPSRSVSGSRWIYDGGPITAAHLADPHGHHAAEHFNRAWLNTLNQDQLTALGSDAHEGRVRDQYVVRDR